MPHRGETEAERQAQRGAFEERRVQRVEALKQELVRDNLLDPHKLDNVQYYRTIEEQNKFIDSITNGQTFARSDFNYWENLEPIPYFGQTIRLKQDQFNRAGGIPLILPKFADLSNISIPEQQFLGMQGLGVETDRKGRIALGGARIESIFKTIEESPQRGAYYQPGGVGYQEAVKQKKPARVFQPAVTEEVTVEAEPGITLDSIVSGITQAVTVQEAAAEPLVSAILPAPTLSQETRKIIDNWSTKKIIVPAWFAKNNINWVLQGKISEEEFIAGYTNLLNTGVITIPTAPTPPTPRPPPIDTSTSLTMISQKWDYFDIVDGRAKGQITFRATSDFNPYYYGKELVNYMQLVNNQGLTIVLKPNVLRFTQTETDETIQYDEGVGDLKSLKVESYVWTHDNKPMSGLYKFSICEGCPPTPGDDDLPRTDFLAKIGGVIAGSLAIALLLPKRIGK